MKQIEQNDEDTYTVRTFLVSKEGKESRKVQQLQFWNWFDHQIPKSSSHFLEFVQTVKKNCTATHEGPLIVHSRYVDYNYNQ